MQAICRLYNVYSEDKLEKEKLYIVIVGLFKRGKSTVINALLEKQLSPVAVTPVTAIVTLFDYAPDTQVTVSFINGSALSVPVEKIGEYVTEKQNPANEKQVRWVNIKDNIELLKLMSIVDTPGLGSVFEHNSTATMNFVPKIDAAIYVLSADIPISSADVQFIEELARKVPKILFVLNKSDLLTHEELLEMLQHDTDVIRKISRDRFEQVDILPVSGKYAGEEMSNINTLRETITGIAQLEKSSLLQFSAAQRLNTLCKQVTMEWQLRLNSLLSPLHVIEEKQKKIARSVSLMQEQKDEFENIIAGRIRTLQQEIHEKVNAVSNNLKKEISNRLQAGYDEGDLLLDDGKLAQLQQELNQLAIEEFEKTKIALEASTRNQFMNILSHYSSRSESFLNELSENLSSLLGIGFNLIADRFDLNVYTSFYLSLDSGQDPLRINRSALRWFASKQYRKKKVRNSLALHYNNILIRNTSSIIYDLQYKIQESFRKFNYDLNNHLTRVIEGMEKIIAEAISIKKKESSEVSDEVERLEAMIDTVRFLTQ